MPLNTAIIMPLVLLTSAMADIVEMQRNSSENDMQRRISNRPMHFTFAINSSLKYKLANNTHSIFGFKHRTSASTLENTELPITLESDRFSERRNEFFGECKNSRRCITIQCNAMRCDCHQIYPEHKAYVNSCISKKTDLIRDLKCEHCNLKACFFYICKNKTDHSSSTSLRFYGIVFIALFSSFMLVIAVCLAVSGRRRPFRNRRAARERLGTNDTLEELSSLTDPPPAYRDVYLIRPQERTISDSFKLPTYAEALTVQDGLSSETGGSCQLTTNKNDENSGTIF